VEDWGQSGTTMLRNREQVVRPMRLRLPIRLARRNVAVLAVAMLVAASAVSVFAQSTERGFVPTDKTTCISCHSNDPRGNLRTLTDIIPPPRVNRSIGTEFEYAVKFHEVWNPQPPDPETVFIAPTLDISRAPSLHFGGGPPDLHNDTDPLTIRPDPTQPQTEQNATTVIVVPPGARTLSFKVTPSDGNPTTGPQLKLIVRTPTGGHLSANATRPGAAVSHNLTAAELLAAGAGNFTVGASIMPLHPNPTDPTGSLVPTLTSVEFTPHYDASFSTVGVVRQTFAAKTAYPAGSYFIQTWRLVAIQEPGSTEQVSIILNATAHFSHHPQVSGDCKVPDWPGADCGDFYNQVDVPVTYESSEVVLQHEVVNLVTPPLNGPTMSKISEAVGYASAFLLLSSIASGGMLGQASRRGFNKLFGSAKRRVVFHNWLSYGLTAAALVHMVIFAVPLVPSPHGIERLAPDNPNWTLGIVWGGLGILAMFGLGVTGALQVPMIRKWNYGTWRWWHYGLTIGAIAFTLLHMVLDGQNFGVAMPGIRESVHWSDPFFHP
jgi:hypothetical protein